MPENEPKGMDEDIQKAIMTLKTKTQISHQQLGFFNTQIEALSKQIRRSELVIEEIKDLPKDINTYKSSGRMFIQKSVPQLIEDLTAQRADCTTRITSLKNNAEMVKKGVAEAEQSLRDIICAKQQMV